jgi:hypothetical protein
MGSLLNTTTTGIPARHSVPCSIYHNHILKKKMKKKKKIVVKFKPLRTFCSTN